MTLLAITPAAAHTLMATWERYRRADAMSTGYKRRDKCINETRARRVSDF